MAPVDVLSLGFGRSSLRVSLRRHPGVSEWFEATITASAPPWQGGFDTIFTADDLRSWAARLRASGLPRTVVLGGNRAAELVLTLDDQQGGTAGSTAVQVEVTPSGDDPYPFLRFLLLEVSPDFGDHAADALDTLLAPPPAG